MTAQTYTAEHFHELLWGWTNQRGQGFDLDDHPERMDEARQLWSDSKVWLLAEWFDTDALGTEPGYEGPGRCSRPFGWWEFDSTEPLRQTSKGPRNSTITDDDLYPGPRWHLGEPRYCAEPADFKISYELQGSYLRRLGLFVDGEAAYWKQHRAAYRRRYLRDGK